ncbi:glycoprotein-N-acetylgalactosamine 3-beta-galactosyltransferase 1-like [Symsagittifera roscoffensis]|uniref:glycoprotein-N-acetylgalactosamine 3-beta-galactosyltransferase 1-like n=1 Tax=Symsagittifera roscoffensis TaxID=84072 RepID=UPI00307C39E1
MNCIDLTVAARCLAGVGVTPGYSLDSVGREQFHSLSPRSEMSSKPPAWLTKYSYHRLQEGLNCCSENTITFHYIGPSEMKLLEVALYRMKVAKPIESQ